MKLDHIGIAVEDLDAAIHHYETVLKIPCDKREIVESENVETAFFAVGDKDISSLPLGVVAPKIELLGATSPDSPIQKFLEKRGEGIHHLAFEVDDLEEEIDRLKDEGYTFLSETPKFGADQKRIIFLHPKEHHGVLIELCQSV
jgi:methylmalonyl-CoA/ethylmalonyl-CoA epimerase